MAMKKRVDIVIPVWNELQYTRCCIDSIIGKTDPEKFNLILVDNGSDIKTADWLRKFAMENKNIFLIRHETNTGYVGGVNSGVQFAREMTKSEYIAVITNDTICPQNWLDMLKHMDDDPQIAIVGPVSNNVAARQHIQYNNQKYDKEFVEILIGLFYVIRADVVDQLVTLDGFYLDELFNFGSSDDLDLSVRVRKMGYKLCIDRKIYVHHFLSKSLVKVATAKNLTLDGLHNKYFQLFVNKHGGMVQQREPYILIGVPTYGLVDHLFWKTSMMLNIPYRHGIETIPRLMPDMARNKLAQMAIDYGFTHLLVLDDDMVYDDQDIITKLVAHNKDIVGVRAYTRSAPHYPCVFYSGGAGDEFYQEVDFDCVGLREVDALGMSMCLINVDVFRKVPGPWFEFGKVKILGKGDEHFGEDVYFCKKAKEAGFKVYCDTNIEIAHVGENKIVTRDSYHQAVGKKVV